MFITSIASDPNPVLLTNNFWNSVLKERLNGAVLPTPTILFGTTFRLIVSWLFKPCVLVLAAPIFVVTVAVISSTSPITWVWLDSKAYSKSSDPLPWKNNPSLVLPIEVLSVTRPI